jgi:hypothetical protein
MHIRKNLNFGDPQGFDTFLDFLNPTCTVSAPRYRVKCFDFSFSRTRREIRITGQTKSNTVEAVRSGIFTI